MRRNSFLGAAASLLAAQTSQGTPPDTMDEFRNLESFLLFLRKRNASQYAVPSSTGVDEESYVPIGGIDQWVSIRGWDRSNPVLLFLHGGPGDPTYPWSFMYFAPWEKHFTIVQWDQRGAGRTLRKSGDTVAETITVDRMVLDGIELAEYLCKHLGKQKIIIVGHSFGSVLGILMARRNPGLFQAYVGTGQVADGARNYFVNYIELIKRAQELGNQEALEELRSFGPPPYRSGAGFRMQWTWSTIFEGADKFLAGNIGRTLVAPGGSVQDLNNDADGMVLSADKLVPQTQNLGPKDLGLEFSIPIFFIQGAQDFTTATSLAREYLTALQAPRKAFIAIPDGGHFAVFIHSNEFLENLSKVV